MKEKFHTWPQGRRCLKCCGLLSIYNPGATCFRHGVIPREKLEDFMNEAKRLGVALLDDFLKEKARCAGCKELYTPVNHQQRFCSKACAKFVRHPGRRGQHDLLRDLIQEREAAQGASSMDGRNV